jgi:hypothetical protein
MADEERENNPTLAIGDGERCILRLLQEVRTVETKFGTRRVVNVDVRAGQEGQEPGPHSFWPSEGLANKLNRLDEETEGGYLVVWRRGAGQFDTRWGAKVYAVPEEEPATDPAPEPPKGKGKGKAPKVRPDGLPS